MSEVETMLRTSSDASRVTAPPQLRRSVLEALRETAHPAPAQPHWFDRWRASISATAALAGVMLLLALIASMVRLNQTPARDSAAARPHPWPALAQVTALGEEFRRPVPNPLIQEARLIIQDARNTVTLIQRQLPVRPRFDPPPSDPPADATSHAQDGA